MSLLLNCLTDRLLRSHFEHVRTERYGTGVTRWHN